MVITPELIKEWKAERRKNVAAERAADMAKMKEFMMNAKNCLRAESRGAMDRVLAALDQSEFDERAKEGILRGHNALAVLDVPEMFKGLIGSPWRCRHWLSGDVHHFGIEGCEWCRSLLERELRSVLAEVSRSRGLKFKLSRNSRYVVLSF